MTVQEAREVARQWVRREAGGIPAFHGAFHHGSTNWLPGDAALPTASDVDVMVVLAGRDLPVKPGKLLYDGVMLEVSYLAADELSSPEAVLGHYQLAGSFRARNVILDPTGELTRLQEAVAAEYAEPRWVLRRCEHARDKVLRNLEALSASEPFHDQVAPWLFAAGVTTHVLLTAGLRNPTVRRRYAAVRELLEVRGRLELYEELLELLGCARMRRARVERHLVALSGAFDAAGAVLRTQFFFASDLTAIARPIAIGGSRELIEGGLHREAVFWIAATYCRCLKVLSQDAPELREHHDAGFRRLLGDLGIWSYGDLLQRREELRRFLPRLREAAEAMVAAGAG